MDRDFHRTLFYPFENGLIDLPRENCRVLIIGARKSNAVPAGWPRDTSWVQGFRPDYLSLQSADRTVAPITEGDGYDLALVLCSRHRGLNEAWIADALSRVKPQGRIVVAGGKTDGIDSLRKRLARQLELEDFRSKFHGTVFWFRKNANAPVLPPVQGMPLADGRFETAPGMFSAGRVDIASRLLAETLPSRLKGSAADFAAGWGYLSAALLQASPDISSLDLYEADYTSLEAAHRNILPLAGNTTLEFHWVDLLREEVGRSYDVVVMNPPFHLDRTAEPEIGTGMIQAASRALKPGGRLFMVANRNLPYEQVLKNAFRRLEEVRLESGFKVLHAWR